LAFIVALPGLVFVWLLREEIERAGSRGELLSGFLI